MDTGPIYIQKKYPIFPEDNSLTLRNRLIEEGVKLQDELLERLEKEKIRPIEQQGVAIHAPLLMKGHGQIRWKEQTAQEIVNLIRGTYEWPTAYSYLHGNPVKIRLADVFLQKDGRPGEIIRFEKGKGLVVKCKTDALLIRRLQVQGKKEMDAVSFLNGAHLKIGDFFEFKQESK